MLDYLYEQNKPKDTGKLTDEQHERLEQRRKQLEAQGVQVV